MRCQRQRQDGLVSGSIKAMDFQAVNMAQVFKLWSGILASFSQILILLPSMNFNFHA
jgi:hypothetical protein